MCRACSDGNTGRYPGRTKQTFVRPPDLIDTELAWAAGFFDGEGYSSCLKYSRPLLNGSRPKYVYVSVSQVDERPLKRFLEAVKVGAIRGPHSSSTTPRGQWSISGSGAAYVMEELLWPYLSEPKREQYLQAKGGVAIQ